MIAVNSRIQDSIVDGPGMRYVLFVQGCNHHCKGCHNPQTWNYTRDNLMSADAIIAEIRENPLTSGVTFSGGEPIDQASELEPIAEWCQQNNLNVIIYTGYLWENIKDLPIMKYVDFVVDGEFIQEQRSWECKFRGSTNQRIIDVKKSIKSGVAIEVDYSIF